MGVGLRRSGRSREVQHYSQGTLWGKGAFSIKEEKEEKRKKRDKKLDF